MEYNHQEYLKIMADIASKAPPVPEWFEQDFYQCVYGDETMSTDTKCGYVVTSKLTVSGEMELLMKWQIHYAEELMGRIGL